MTKPRHEIEYGDKGQEVLEGQPAGLKLVRCSRCGRLKDEATRCGCRDHDDLQAIRELVSEQAEDEGLWFDAQEDDPEETLGIP